MDPPIRTSKERKEGAQEVSKYLDVLTPDEREMPGFEGKLAKWDRHRSVSYSLQPASPHIGLISQTRH